VPDVFTMLESDHRTVESLLAEIEASEQGPEREALVVKVTQALQLHMQFEEGEVYPLLKEVDDGMEQEAEVEHQLARDGLAKMTELAAAPGFGAAVEMVKAGISHHGEEEEQEAFPKLRNSCDDATVERLGQALLQRKAQAGTLADDLEGATKGVLSQIAEQFGVEGRTSMTKPELIEAIGSATKSKG